MLRHLIHPHAIYSLCTSICICIVSPTVGTPLLFCRVFFDSRIDVADFRVLKMFDGCNWHTLHEQSIILHKTFKLTNPQNAGPALNSSAFSISESKQLLPAIVGSPEPDLVLESLGAPPEHRFFGITSRPCHLCHSAMSTTTRLSRHDTSWHKHTHALSRGLLGCLCVNELWIRSLVVRIYDQNVLPHVQSSERPQSALPIAGWCSLMDTNGHQRYVSTRGNAWEREANHTASVQLCRKAWTHKHEYNFIFNYTDDEAAHSPPIVLLMGGIGEVEPTRRHHVNCLLQISTLSPFTNFNHQNCPPFPSVYTDFCPWIMEWSKWHASVLAWEVENAVVAWPPWVVERQRR